MAEGNQAAASCLDAKAQAAIVLQLAAVHAAAAAVAGVVGAAAGDAVAVAEEGCAGGAVSDADAAAQDCPVVAYGAESRSTCCTGHLLAGQPAMQRKPAVVELQVASLAET